MLSVRPPAVAGSFYPRDALVLARDVARFLEDAQQHLHAAPTQCPKALVVPHAGYVYSASTAALAYAQLMPWSAHIRKVVLLGPVHRVATRGLALPGVDLLATPLGTVRLDDALIETLQTLTQVVTYPGAHALEHSLEVQLPFLQTVLPTFTLVPLAVGDASASDVAEVLDAVWGGSETLIVVSTDLSHYLPYAQAQATDRETLQAVLSLKPEITHAQACGATPLNGLLRTARHHDLQPDVLGMCNSGDTAGDRSRVVGYAAIAFTPETHVTH